MSFAHGFEKTAFQVSDIAKGVGVLGAKASKVKKKVTEIPANLARKGAQARMEGAHSVAGGKSRDIGEGLYNTRAKRMAEQGRAPSASEGEQMAAKAKTQTMERKSRMDQYKQMKAQKERGSFAKRHPVATAVGTGLALHAALGGGDQQQQQQPPPQISYY